jgi:hypothetical protein
MLHEAPSQRASYVAGDKSEGFIPVTVVIRTAQGLISGEMVIPANRWDPWLFLLFLRSPPSGSDSGSRMTFDAALLREPTAGDPAYCRTGGD